jgi:hypothetical protein
MHLSETDEEGMAHDWQPRRLLVARLLPALLAVILAAAGLRYLGERAGYYGLETGLILMVGVVSVLVVAIVLWVAAILDRAATDQRGTDVELRTRERMFRTLLDSAPDAVVIVDQSGRIVIANEKADEMFGYERSQLLGVSVERLMPERGAGAHAATRSAYLKAPASRPMGEGLALSARRGDGSEFPVEISLAPLDATDTTYVISIIRDVTGRKRFEENLQQTQKLEAVGQLAAGIAHDFNNLLTAIGGYASLLVDSLAERPELRSDAEEISRAAISGAKLTRQLLTFTRSDPHRPALVDLVACCRNSEGLLQLSLGARVELEIHAEVEPLPVEIDPSLFEQVLLNLALNAGEAMPAGGKLTLSLSRAKADLADGRPFVQLAVTDTGTGMDEETCRRAFEPFFTTKERDRGTGLGLAAAWGIVSRAGGEARLISSLGVGTTLLILLPEATGQIGAPEPAPQRAAAAQATGETILILEDEPAVRGLVSGVLTAAGYRCLTAGSGTEALDIAVEHEGRIDLFLTDIVVPGIPSRELAQRLGARYPNLRVLAMSGYAGEEFAGTDSIGKGTPFLPKPFTPETLLRAVSRALVQPERPE